MKPLTILWVALGLILAVLLALLVYNRLGFGTNVRGSINYQIQGELPAGSQLIIELRDTSYQDAPSITVVRQVVADPGPPPHRFDIDYGSAAIDGSNTYSIGVRIEGPAGELFFINDIAHDVITGGNPKQVDIDLVPVLPLT